MLTLTLEMVKTTKGTHKFEETPAVITYAGRPILGSLYLTKDGLLEHKLLNAKRIQVTITEVQEVKASDVG